MEDIKRFFILIAILFLIWIRRKFANPDFVELPLKKYLLIVVAIIIICLAKYALDRLYH